MAIYSNPNGHLVQLVRFEVDNKLFEQGGSLYEGSL